MSVKEWFEKNRFHAEDYSDIGRLAKIKRRQKKRISCIIPTLNEEKNVGKVIEVIKKISF